MKSRTTERFRRSLARLPSNVQEQARHAFRVWRESPHHPSLQFKRIHSRDPIYSVRIGINWRALAVLRDNSAVWFWIGPHSEYETLVSQL
jgi:mRNA-degrading endonuclease RelE of RelBE toxin-antitoxin system